MATGALTVSSWVSVKVLISQVTQCYDSPPVQAGFFGVNMAVKISGVLKDGTGKPVENCTIQLKARRTSSTVVVNTVAQKTRMKPGVTAWTLSMVSTASFCWWRDFLRHMPGPSPCMKILNRGR